MARLATRPLGVGHLASTGTDSDGPEPLRGRSAPGRNSRRNLPLVAVGVLLVAGCAIGFSSAWLRAGGRQQVLVVTGYLSAGQVLSSSDLKAVQISTGNGLPSIPASEAAAIVGHPVALPLTLGTLLTEADLGPSTGPPSGRAVVGLALKPGQYPPGITPGSRVLVVVGGGGGGSSSSGPPTAASSSSANAPLEATVVGVEPAPANSADSVVVSVQLAEGNGGAVAAAGSAGNVALAIISSGAGS